MKSLVRRVLERAEAEGGNEWLQRCLALSAGSDTAVTTPAEQQLCLSTPEAEDVFQQVILTDSQRSSSMTDTQQGLPEERAMVRSALVQESSSLSSGERGMAAQKAQRSSQRGKRSRRAFSPSPIRSSRGRGRARRSSISPGNDGQGEEQVRRGYVTLQPASQRMLPPQAERSPQLSGQHSRQVSQARAAASLASRPSRLDAGRAPVSSSLLTGPVEDIQTETAGAQIPVICNPAETSLAGESANNDLMSQLLLSLAKFNEHLVATQPEYTSPSPANVWSSIPAETDINSLMSINTPKNISLAPAIPETCFKEVLPCEMSPLGFHLPVAIKEKIWKGEFLDLLSLLPVSKEFLSKLDKRSDDNMEDARRRPVSRSFFNWLQAFCIFSAVMGERHPEKCAGLFQHLEHILEAYKSFGGMGWFNYDESFRQKIAIYPSLKWGNKDVGLWLNLITPQKQNFNRPQPQFIQSTPNSAYKKGTCYAYNESQCKWLASCRYRHECSFCFGNHPVVKCFKRVSAGQVNREHAKSLHTSEAVRNAPMAGAISRQGEGPGVN